MSYLQEFVLNPGQPSKTKVKKGPLEVPQPESRIIQYREIDAIFSVSPIEGTASRKVVYINEARKRKYPTVLTGPPLLQASQYGSRTLTHQLCTSRTRCSNRHHAHQQLPSVKILVDGENSVNILYKGALDRMENTPEIARAMIGPQTQSHLYGFDRNETRSSGTISLPVRADPYTVITEFYMDSHNGVLHGGRGVPL